MAPSQSDKMETMDAVHREKGEGDVIDRENDHISELQRRVHGAALILLGVAVASAPLAASRGGMPGFVAAYTAASALWFFCIPIRISPRAMVATAVILRLAVAAAPPLLSGDVYRYLWDGRELSSGHNPYARAPLGEARINHPEIPTIYPPLAELLFAGAHRLALWRPLMIAADATIVALLPPQLAMAYATMPLAIFEGTWSAHVEVAAALLLLIALMRGSGLAAGAAAGIKIIPLAALPALVRRSNRRGRVAAAAAAAFALPFIPFLAAGPVMPGMRDYATRWIFNAPAYELVRAAVARLPLKELWTAIKGPLGLEPLAPVVYRYLYDDFVTRCLLAALAVVLVLLARRASDGIAALLLCSPALHPWYWLVLVPAALVERRRIWIAFALCAPLSYLLYVDVSRWLVYALCYAVPPLIARIRTLETVS
jgi:hypothetical protein